MMTPEELHFYIRKKLKRGYPQGELHNDLLKDGYTSEEVQDAFNYAVKNPGNSGPKKETDFPFWLFLSAGSFILGVSLMAVPFTWLSQYRYIFLGAGAAGIIIYLLLREQKKKNG